MADPESDILPKYNMKSTGVKRLMKEAAELRNPTDMYYAQPVEDNLFEWHFTVRGPADTDFDGGVYHGRILLPADYPMKPPSVILLTPNGRFQLNQKICLSISGHHPESWQPSWSIRTALLALIGFMPTHGAGALGSLEYPPKERRRLAALSCEWVCKQCNLRMADALAKQPTESNQIDAQEARQLATQISFKDESDVKNATAASSAINSAPILLDKPAGPSTTTGNRNAATNAAAAGRVASANSVAQSRAPPGIPLIGLAHSSRRISWELPCIWLLTAIVAGLLLRRLALFSHYQL